MCGGTDFELFRLVSSKVEELEGLIFTLHFHQRRFYNCISIWPVAHQVGRYAKHGFEHLLRNFFCFNGFLKSINSLPNSLIKLQPVD